MELILLKQALEDRDYWKRSDDKTVSRCVMKNILTTLTLPGSWHCKAHRTKAE